MGARQKERFLIRLAEALHAYGTPSNRVEAALISMGTQIGVSGQYLVTPTSILASIGPVGNQRTLLSRVEPGETNLEKLTTLNEIMHRVVDGLPVDAATHEIERLISARLRYPPLLTTLAYALASATAAVLLGGGLGEMWASVALGLGVGLLAVIAIRLPRLGAVYPAMAAIIAGIVPRLASAWFEPIYPFVATLGGLIVLIPGLTLTIAVNELAHRHLVSGTARLTGAIVTFLQIGLGVAVGWAITDRLVGQVPIREPESIGLWGSAIALLASAPAFTVLFRARPRDLPAILGAAITAYTSARLSSNAFGPEIGAAVGAFLLGSFSNVLARWRDRPSAITLLPGLLLLVPGTVGLRSLGAMLQDDVLSGIETGFSMVLIAVSLVTGLLLANALLPSRRLL